MSSQTPTFVIVILVSLGIAVVLVAILGIALPISQASADMTNLTHTEARAAGALTETLLTKMACTILFLNR
jgi:hypothetical protein